jgi:hypothetical protein
MCVSLVDRTEIHHIDGRAITVHTGLKMIHGWLKWDEPTMHLGDGPSILDTIVIHGKLHPEHGNFVHQSLLEQTREGHERARARLQTVRSLFFSGQGMFPGSLVETLELFPTLEKFSSEIPDGIYYRNAFQGALLCKWLCHSKNALIEASLRGHGVSEETPTLDIGHGDADGMNRGADLAWLPYFRRCKKLRLPCHIQWVAEFGSEPVFPEIQIPSVNISMILPWRSWTREL